MLKLWFFVAIVLVPFVIAYPSSEIDDSDADSDDSLIMIVDVSHFLICKLRRKPIKKFPLTDAEKQNVHAHGARFKNLVLIVVFE